MSARLSCRLSSGVLEMNKCRKLCNVSWRYLGFAVTLLLFEMLTIAAVARSTLIDGDKGSPVDSDSDSRGTGGEGMIRNYIDGVLDTSVDLLRNYIDGIPENAFGPVMFDKGIAVLTKTWAPVRYSKTLNDPVVVISVLEFGGGISIDAMIRNVTDTGFEARLAQPVCRNSNETLTMGVNYLAVSKGEYVLDNGRRMIVERVTSSGGDLYSFATPFKESPVVISMPQDFPDDVISRMRNLFVGKEDCYLFMINEEDLGKSSVPRTIGYIAIDVGEGIFGSGIVYKAERIVDGYGRTPKDYSYSSMNAQEHALFGVIGLNSAASAVLLQSESAKPGKVTLEVVEDTGGDCEMLNNHELETVDILVIGLKSRKGLGIDSTTAVLKDIADQVGVIWLEYTQVLNTWVRDSLKSYIYGGPKKYRREDMDNGVVAITTTTWSFVNFTKTLNDPVVVISVLHLGGGTSVDAMIRNVSNTGFEARLAEPVCRNSGESLTMSVKYLAISKGQYTVGNDKMVVDTVRSSGTAMHSFVTPFTKSPVLVSMQQDFPDERISRTRNLIVTNVGFELVMTEENSVGTNHTPRTIGYIALEEGEGNLGGEDVVYKAERTPSLYQNDPVDYSLVEDVQDHALFGVIGYSDAGSAILLQSPSVNPGNVRLQIVEDTAGSCTMDNIHEPETIHILVIGSPTKSL